MRLFWKRRERETLGEWSEGPSPFADSSEVLAARPLAETIEIERDTSRAASISRVAEGLRRRGEEIVEIFKVVASSEGQAVLPIHLRRGGEDVFVEVKTEPWTGKTVRDVLKTAAVLRDSVYSDAVFEVLSAYPVPEEVSYFCGQTPAVLFQLDLVCHDDPKEPETCARAFRNAAERHWGLDLGYNPEELQQLEELLLTVLDERPSGGMYAPVLDALVRGLGCYVGEILRRHTASQSSWRPGANSGDDLVIEFPNAIADPIGNARAFLKNGPEDSVAYYVAYALKELND